MCKSNHRCDITDNQWCVESCDVADCNRSYKDNQKLNQGQEGICIDIVDLTEGMAIKSTSFRKETIRVER